MKTFNVKNIESKEVIRKPVHIFVNGNGSIFENLRQGAEDTDRLEPASKKYEIINASDGYHTFGELYDHRISLFIALCRQINNQPYGRSSCAVWRSRRHSDGSKYEGWFILGIGIDKGDQITYHLPLDRWNETFFAMTLDEAPEFDGHASGDVLERLKKFI